jgi:Fic family protein
MNLMQIIFNGRVSQNITLKELAAITGIDTGLLSKYQNGDRVPSKPHLDQLISALKLNADETRSAWLGEKIYKLLDDDPASLQALYVAEARVKYVINRKQALHQGLSSEIREQLSLCDELRQDWAKLKPLNATQLRKMEEYFNLNYTYESNRIEGNTLTLQETHLVINEGMTVGGKSMREHLEAVNHSEAIEYLAEIVRGNILFTERILKQIHHLILKGIDRENAGSYRLVGVRISGSAHIPPEPYLLTRLMEEVFEYYEDNRTTMHPVILASEMHERIVRIHPFIDGNGRTCRLVMNLILMQNGFPIANIKGDNHTRMAYYTALENAESDGKSSFHALIAEAVAASLREHIELSK